MLFETARMGWAATTKINAVTQTLENVRDKLDENFSGYLFPNFIWILISY